jgi:hypothetical protein
MPTCASQATLVITRSIEGTSTDVVRERVQLQCQLEAGHEGVHRDTRHDESWEAKEGQRPTLLKHEDEIG